jgi:N-carbamoyl-L-amino-acid hydrolase
VTPVQVTDVDLAPLWSGLAGIGRSPDTGGYRRFAWTPADLDCREWFRAEAAARQLAVETDRNGNLWAWWGDPQGGGAVVTGSHLDSVPDGGGYDGPLGVVSALAAVDVLRRRGVTPARPVAVTVFADEEGARFGVACVGSRLLTGQLEPDRARALTDPDGVTLAEAMRRAGHDPQALGPDPERLSRIGAVVELHIEQGRALADLDAPVGVASGIWPHGRFRLDFAGTANHAGTTRLADREDPMLPLAVTVLAARAAAKRHEALATVGRVDVRPNATNAVPGRATAWLDVRGHNERIVRAVVRDVAAAAGVPAAEESWTPEVNFDGSIGGRLRGAAAEATGADAPALPTGAGHDAGILAAAGRPAGMLFVRNPTGVSHAPAEHAEPADCRAGVAALAEALARLASG